MKVVNEGALASRGSAEISLRDCVVSVVGLGLIGGSLAWALKRSGAARLVVGYNRSPHISRQALAQGIIDTAAESPVEAASLADLLILAVPVGAMAEIFEACRPGLSPGTVITDVGSAKADVIHRLMPLIPPGCEFVGGHPMAGSEASGIDAATPDLFLGSTYVLCPTPLTGSRSRKLMSDLVAAVGSKLVWMEASTHDAGVAYVSHLPYLVAAALVKSTIRAKSGVTDILASGGYRDATRIACSDPSMSADFCLANKGYILEAASIYRKEFEDLMKPFSTPGEDDMGKGSPKDGLVAMLDEAREYRVTLGTKKGWIEKGGSGRHSADAFGSHAIEYFPPVTSPLSGCIRLPGDKSISHRVVILGSLAGGESVFTNVSTGADVNSTINAMKTLGAVVEVEDRADAAGLTVIGESHGAKTQCRKAKVGSCRTGSDEGLTAFLAGKTVVTRGNVLDENGAFLLREPEEVIDCGNSGTTMRLLAGVLAAFPFLSVLTGDSSLRQRPMGRIVEPLTAMGAKIHGRSGGRYAPLVITGGDLRDFEYRLPVASAQVKSAILLAGLCSGRRVSVAEDEPSRDHTERLLPFFGVQVRREEPSASKQGETVTTPLPRVTASIPRGTGDHGHLPLLPVKYEVPGDISSAAFFMVAAGIVPGSRLEIHDLLLNPLRTGVLDVLEEMGIVVTRVVKEHHPEPRGTVIIEAPSSGLKPVEISGSMVPRLIDEIPVIAVAATQARGKSVIRNASELRVKETDRINALVKNLTAIGAKVAELPDGMIIDGPVKLQGGIVDSYGDHRIAMAMAVASTVSKEGIHITRSDCVDISFPGFYEAFRGICGCGRTCK
ncbi:MAG TPA: 3-phosphoshikimate 1-carboxyvinyltransferase [Clostridia bacterium]|nr:3-phosphoshikimate 1-carboxyvinyltransferase [Clostridia bacterium]